MKTKFEKMLAELLDIAVFAILAGLALVGYADLFQESAYTKAILGFVTIFALTHRILEKYYKQYPRV